MICVKCNGKISKIARDIGNGWEHYPWCQKDEIPIMANGTFVGSFYNGIFMTNRIFKDHYYRNGKGYAVSTEALDELNLLLCHTIVIFELRPDGMLRQCDFRFEDYMNAMPFQHEGYDEQKCVPLSEAIIINVLNPIYVAMSD